MYYVAIVIDPILRFNWILYVILPRQLQQSALTSFFIALSEVCRRGMWSLFRVENEHCSNVGHFRASRDVPLPYEIPSSPEVSGRPSGETEARPEGEQLSPHLRRTSTAPTASGVDLETGGTRPSPHRRRATSFAAPPGGQQESPIARGLTRMGTIIRDAHAQDFERKRKPELGTHTSSKVDEETDDEDEDGDEHSAEEGSRAVSPGTRYGEGDEYADIDAEDDREIREIREQVAAGMEGEAESGEPPGERLS